VIFEKQKYADVDFLALQNYELSSLNGAQKHDSYNPGPNHCLHAAAQPYSNSTAHLGSSVRAEAPSVDWCASTAEN
jgi:hypothetical protein